VTSSYRFENWILRTLDRHGPQDLRSLLWLLQSDPEFGYLPLNDQAFESKLRSWLVENSRSCETGLVRREGYKWFSNVTDITPQVELPRLSQAQPWLSIGHGNESVYGLFHPRAMHQSRLEGSNYYPVKIGRTRRHIASRIFELQTGSVHELQLGILIKTNDSVHVEKFIHSAFKGCRLKILQMQSEWFLTSLDEIRRFVLQELQGSLDTWAS